MWKDYGAGEKTLYKLPPVQYFDIDSEDITLHEDYDIIYENNSKNVVNDIALIKLPRRADMNDMVKFACLPAYPEDLKKEFK